MENLFDFYALKIGCSKKTPLKAAAKLLGVGCRIEEHRNGYTVIGRRSYPKYYYTVSVGTLAAQKSEELSQRLDAISATCKDLGIRVMANYIARD